MVDDNNNGLQPLPAKHKRLLLRVAGLSWNWRKSCGEARTGTCFGSWRG